MALFMFRMSSCFRCVQPPLFNPYNNYNSFCTVNNLGDRQNYSKLYGYVLCTVVMHLSLFVCALKTRFVEHKVRNIIGSTRSRVIFTKLCRQAVQNLSLKIQNCSTLVLILSVNGFRRIPRSKMHSSRLIVIWVKCP